MADICDEFNWAALDCCGLSAIKVNILTISISTKILTFISFYFLNI